MKRKAQRDHPPPIKKRTRVPLSDAEVRSRFRAGLLDPSVLAGHAARYAESGPFRHGVIDRLVDDTLLRQVRAEIRSSVSFTPKETDIYKIHQSGDLANLDGLDDSELRRLPALLRLRDALYSDSFRAYVSAITGCGPLSGTKTDMAVNVYTPGCFLLCHDDVIGSRRVSYILYLTNPDEPWKPEWGGALRLYGTEQRGKAKTPTPDPVRIIAPAWNQLSFFAVQPGESFHDVEEVYEPEEEEVGREGDAAGKGTGTGKGTVENKPEEGGARRVRMAISGWFHLPQAGEDGFVRGAVEELMVNSSLAQLSGNPDQYDLPQPRPVRVTAPPGQDFDEADLEFLLKYINPTYLTPGTIEGISGHFDLSSTIILPAILCEKFAARLRKFVTEQEAQPIRPGATTVEIEKATAWRVARPPHKHHFLYQQPAGPDQLRASREESPLTELLDVLLPSRQFRKWLHFATGFDIVSHDILARRFRRGSDYTLATGHAGKPHLEINLGFTPTQGWGDDGDGEEEEDEEGMEDDEGVEDDEGEGEKEDDEEKEGENEKGADSGGTGPGDDHDKDASRAGGLTGRTEGTNKRAGAAPSCDDVGGLEVYMADDEDDQAHDAAVYRPTSGPDGDDGNVLFFQPAAWNKMTMVLRDRGSLRFVKYVSRRARGDRWDISAVFGIVDPTESGEEDGGDRQERSGEAQQQQQRQQSAEEDGKSKSTDTDSD